MAFVKIASLPKRRKKIAIPQKELVQEHEHLIDVLRHDGKRGKAEARKQASELAEYRKGKA